MGVLTKKALRCNGALIKGGPGLYFPSETSCALYLQFNYCKQEWQQLKSLANRRARDQPA